ncbi:MAG TPA: peptidoglycan-binding domain-containing protein [Mesorhizobium sp.]|nr:peptidoglycan-binding domain-containing protein [Mesorhizobium sp.]
MTAHGCATGLIDGVLGPVSMAALRAFEKAQGLPVDGTADRAVVQLLRAPALSVGPNSLLPVPDRDCDPLTRAGEDALAAAKGRAGMLRRKRSTTSLGSKSLVTRIRRSSGSTSGSEKTRR